MDGFSRALIASPEQANLFNKHVQHFICFTHIAFFVCCVCTCVWDIFFVISLIVLQISAITLLPDSPPCVAWLFPTFGCDLSPWAAAAAVTSNKKLNKFSDKLLQQHFFTGSLSSGSPLAALGVTKVFYMPTDSWYLYARSLMSHPAAAAANPPSARA